MVQVIRLECFSENGRISNLGIWSSDNSFFQKVSPFYEGVALIRVCQFRLRFLLYILKKKKGSGNRLGLLNGFFGSFWQFVWDA